MQVSSRVRGFSMVIVAAMLWGVSGTVAQSLFHHYSFTTDWLTSVRLVASGVVLLLLSLMGENRQNVTRILRSGGDFVRLVVFGICGLMAVQYTYFASIEQGNAATATLLQYLGPLFLTLFLVLRYRKMPTVMQIVALVLALLGTFLLITNGKPGQLSIAPGAVIWGLLSAVALAFYTLYPKKLLDRWGSTVVLGWGMLIGGISLSAIAQPWQVTGQIWDVSSVLGLCFLVVFGTLIPFFLYLDSMRFIQPSEASILGCAEPLSAVVATVVWLHVSFGLFEWAGAACIIGTVIALSRNSPKKMEAPREQHV